MAESKRQSISDALKAAIKRTGKSTYAVAKESGVSQAVLQRFVTGQRGLTLETVDRLCDYLELELKNRQDS